MKYNDNGRWKPLTYPVDTTAIQREIAAKIDDERLQGVLFYYHLTGYKVVEFAVKCGIWLENQETVFANNVHLFRVTKEDDPTAQNLVVYDGWLPLPDVEVETVRSGLDEIARMMNVLALAYQQQVTWTTKYTIIDHRRGQGRPDMSDMKLFDRILKRDLDPEARRIIAAALDWYARGERTNSVFNRFLGFWIAMEGLAVSLYDGKLGDVAPFVLPYETDTERTTRVQACIQQYVSDFTSARDPRLIERAYFDCIRSLRYKTKETIRAVFGDSRGMVRRLFEEKEDGFTIEEIRHQVAHGDVVEWDFTHESRVRKRVGLLGAAAREFVLRVLLRSKPDEELEDWSRLHSLSMDMMDPRSILVMSDDRMLPKTDWTIRPEWIA